VPGPRTHRSSDPERPSAAPSIRIFNLAGATSVTGWDRDSIVVTGTVPPGAGTFFIGGAGAGAKLGVTSDSLDAPGAVLDVFVPRGATVWVKSSTADVTLRAEAFAELGNQLQIVVDKGKGVARFAPMEPMGMPRSEMGDQVRPAFSVFHTPPPTGPK